MVWIALIAVCNLAGHISALVLHGRVIALHTVANKAAGLALFVTVPVVLALGSPLPAIPACLLATFAAIQEGHLIRTGKAQA